MEEMLEEVRVEAKTIVTGIPSSAFDEFKNRPDFCNSKSWGLFVAFHVLPFDVVAKLLNPLLKELCPNSQMILMKLHAPDGDQSGADEYMKGVREKYPDEFEQEDENKPQKKTWVRGTQGTYRPKTVSEEQAYYEKKYGKNKYAK